jgi:hypothetical protein
MPVWWAVDAHLQLDSNAVGASGGVLGGAAGEGVARALVDDLEAHRQRLPPHVARRPAGRHRIHPLPIVPRYEPAVLQHLCPQ